ncbi:Monocarboxylate transporter 12 [Chionoecetes opilio]|uniref:Monocarboxylate transporter 12 n=1 Tax=Chionoecetes opilio TaxID=41210 RepID=A0A8J5CJS7_CHIOP|nr:Monocarboxylate transporter 12 [Chionoecetes opilio]
MAAVFLVNTLCAGYIRSFGIIYLMLMEYFPDTSGVAGGWILGLLMGTRGLLAPVMGAMAVKVGPRKCVLTGALLVALGLILAVPALNIYYMAVTLGALVGIGVVMSETPGVLLVTDYFVEKRTLANGLRAAGNPMGGILFSPLVVFLKEQFGLRGSFIIMAGVMLHLAILATLMRPFELQEQIIHQRHLKKTALNLELKNASGTKINQTARRKPPPKKALDSTLFKNPQYLMYLVMILSVGLPLPNFLLYIPAYGQSLGLTSYQLAVLTSYQSGVDIAFRLLCGSVVQKLHLDEGHVFVAGLLVGGVGCLLVTLCYNMWQLLLAITLFSFGMAIFYSLLNTLLAKHFGAESMASSWGFLRMVQGIMNFIYPSLLGLVKDLTGSLVTPFLMMGSGFILGGCIFSLKPFIGKISKAQNNSEQPRQPLDHPSQRP